MRNQLCDWGDSGDSGGGVGGVGKTDSAVPLGCPLSEDSRQAKAPNTSQGTDTWTPGRSRFSDSLSQEARTALGGAGQARIPAGIFQPSRLRLAQPGRPQQDGAQVLPRQPALAQPGTGTQPFVRETRGSFSPSRPRAGWHCQAWCHSPQQGPTEVRLFPEGQAAWRRICEHAGVWGVQRQGRGLGWGQSL